jgi:hypothetical protein
LIVICLKNEKASNVNNYRSIFGFRHGGLLLKKLQPKLRGARLLHSSPSRRDPRFAGTTLTFDRVAKAVTIVRTKINRQDVCSMVQDAPLTLYLGEPLDFDLTATDRVFSSIPCKRARL